MTNNEAQCKPTFSDPHGEIHRCELFDGHEGNHRRTYEWRTQTHDI